ncbi:hypothetical protein [Flavobacterium sp.]|jgi:hypothetical protein|uniref:hypothetical protein n=1 Tax=Flavobacterium sp. TaxID=239 RepID=UPI0037C0DB43
MKYLITIFCFLIFTTSANSQEKSKSANSVDIFYLDSLYSNKDELIIFSEIHKFDNLNVSEIKNKIKNWASLKFVNLREVLISETDDQIVLNYITSSLYVKSLGVKTPIQFYIRLQIQIKDGRVKYTYFDDGNVRMLPSQYSSGVQARSFYLKDYFSEKNGSYVSRKGYAQGMADLVASIKENFYSVIVNNEAVKKLNDNW